MKQRSQLAPVHQMPDRSLKLRNQDLNTTIDNLRRMTGKMEAQERQSD